MDGRIVVLFGLPYLVLSSHRLPRLQLLQHSATWENLKYMDHKKERYLVALRAKIKSTGFLEEIKIPREEGTTIDDNEVAASVIKRRRKYVVVWNASVVETNKKDRESRIRRAEEELCLWRRMRSNPEGRGMKR